MSNAAKSVQIFPIMPREELRKIAHMEVETFGRFGRTLEQTQEAHGLTAAEASAVWHLMQSAQIQIPW